ncbi:MAG TPA: hypothetical protein VK463_00090 [Desulfomonilaceae bacterium]|nr:hypothetical protein [Desulfomonilaceae bacterium]
MSVLITRKDWKVVIARAKPEAISNRPESRLLRRPAPLNDMIRIRRKMYGIAGLEALLSEVMRRLCVVRSARVPPACARNRVARKKANPYEWTTGMRARAVRKFNTVFENRYMFSPYEIKVPHAVKSWGSGGRIQVGPWKV